MQPFSLVRFVRSTRNQRRSRRKAAVEMLENRVLLTAITSNQFVQANLATATQKDTYTFSASAGNALEVSLGTAYFPGVSTMTLKAPNGTALATLTETSAGQVLTTSLVAPATGTYSAVISSANKGTGYYGVEVAVLPAVQHGTAGIISGQAISASLTGGLDVHTFTANAGNAVELSLGTTYFPGITALDLYSPAGTLVTTLSETTAGQVLSKSLLAPSTGTYSIVTRTLQNKPGYYQFDVAVLPHPQFGNSTVRSGQSISAQLTGELDVHTFYAGSGKTIELSLGTTYFPDASVLELYSPKGKVLKTLTETTKGQILTGSVTASSTGTYFIVVKSADAGTGYYQFTAAVLPGGQFGNTNVESNQAISDNLTGQIDVRTFFADAGSAVEVALGTTYFPGKSVLELFSPSGAVLTTLTETTAGQFLSSKFTAPATGTYFVVVKSAANLTGYYQFDVAIAPENQFGNSNVVSGQAISGNLAGELDVHTFVAIAGGTMTVDFGTTYFPTKAVLELYAPNGTLVTTLTESTPGQALKATITPATDGTFYLVTKSAASGYYGFTVTQAASTFGNMNVTVKNSSGALVSGALVVRTDQWGDSIDSLNTAANGIAAFGASPSGTYNISVYSPAAAFWGSATTTVTNGATINVTVMQPLLGSISGRVFSDANSNGAVDSGESGLGLFTVYLDLNNNGTFDAGDKSVTTDISGNWSFTGLVAKTYSVKLIAVAGYTATKPSNDTLSVVLAAGQNSPGHLFGQKSA